LQAAFGAAHEDSHVSALKPLQVSLPQLAQMSPTVPLSGEQPPHAFFVVQPPAPAVAEPPPPGEPPAPPPDAPPSEPPAPPPDAPPSEPPAPPPDEPLAPPPDAPPDPPPPGVSEAPLIPAIASEVAPAPASSALSASFSNPPLWLPVMLSPATPATEPFGALPP